MKTWIEKMSKYLEFYQEDEYTVCEIKPKIFKRKIKNKN